MATLDPPLNVLRDQILAATTLRREEIGWIAGASHRQSGPHFPENPPPPGNPPYEVDAIDPPHDPARGADMGVLTEALRLSRDPRIKLVIFNRRIFSSYDHAEGDPYTWRPYREKDPHTGHAHIERTDQRRDDLRPWQIGIDMALSEAEAYVLHVINYRVAALLHLDPQAKVPAANGRAALITENKLATALAGLGSTVTQLRAAVDALPDDVTMSDEELTALADGLAAKLPPELATKLAESLTLRFNSTSR